MLKRWKTILLIAFLGLTACSQEPDHLLEDNMQLKEGRWYSYQQVMLGEQVYETHCIACHKEKASGTTEWKKTLTDGSYPPPPLNGTAHAWHHSISVLTTVINEGGEPFGGKMPAFKLILNDTEKKAVIAYFQSFWSEEIYDRWQQINQPKAGS